MIYTNSEIGTLKKVLVHRPDEGIARISPKRAEELLFDDIVHLPKMQEEHDEFTAILKAFLGEDAVKEVEDLLTEALEEDRGKRKLLVERIIDFEEMPSLWIDKLLALDNDDLAKVLITGYHQEEDHIIFDPIPNFIFTRDIAVTVKDHIIITKAAKEARHRENLLTRFLVYTHPMFAETVSKGNVINLNDIEAFPPSRYGQSVSIEGGDMMMIQDNFLLIDDRSCMHIDTIFTRISEDDVVCFKPTVYDGDSSNVIVHRKGGDVQTYDSVRSFFWAEINRDTKFIFSGDGKSPYQEREQWTDGCNLVALRPGIGLTYDRNPWTEKSFAKAGYKVIHATDLLDDIKTGKTDPSTMDKTIITLNSSELSRARGGSHCMTCPVIREKSESIRATGISYRDMEERLKIMMPVMSVNSRFLRPIHYDENITIRTILKEMPTKLMAYEHVILNENGDIAHKGEVKLFFVDMNTNKRVSAPDYVTNALLPHFAQ